MIIDSHCHVSDVWYEPVETLLHEMDRNGVDKAVLVQLLGQFNNEYQQQCFARYPDRFRSVVGIDAEADDAVDTLYRLADQGAVGVRLRPEARSPGSDPLAIWRSAQERGLAISCVGSMAMFLAPKFAAILQELDAAPVVLEHLGGIARPDSCENKPGIMDLARFDNVYLKIPGLGQLTPRARIFNARQRPLSDDAGEWLLEAVKNFGADRLMWGSDFPPVAAREGYGNALRWSRDALSHLKESDIDKLYGNVALRVFGF